MDSKRPYSKSLRRLLIDMHIPDWDKEFLANFDTSEISSQALATGADGIMVYFQSHVGLCNWPTKSGVQHAHFKGQDPMLSLVTNFKDNGVGVCAYYSTIFNTWASNENPEWQIVPAAPAIMGPLPMGRYGLCCPNNPHYRDFVVEQLKEIVTGYEIDTFFFDMVWWPAVCLCKHCEARCIEELGHGIPQIIDWSEQSWSAFQSARENWIIDFAMCLKNEVQDCKPEVKVYHNFALGMSNWSRGLNFASSEAHDFLGGDFYGGRDEQLVISKLMLNLSQSRPTEFMTTVARNLVDHEQFQSTYDLEAKTFGALTCNSAFLMIAAIDPDGLMNQAMVERIAKIYEQTSQYEPYLGGDPIEDIAVYFSDYSKMNFEDDGKSISSMSCGAIPDYPHFEAVRGACKKLSSAHLPFGVITRQNLSNLESYKVIILPNVLRMHVDEVSAFRAYVSGGGKLYASRLSSLNGLDSTTSNEFLLSDVFGCHYQGEHMGRITYSNPQANNLQSALSPERYLGHRRHNLGSTGAVDISVGTGTTLATLSLPYGYPHEGTTQDQNWASIHSDPPWLHLDKPTIVSNKYGKGRAIYLSQDIEAGDSDGCTKVFISVIRDLLGVVPQFEAETHPAVWVNAFNQENNNRFIVSFLNYQLEFPAVPIPEVRFKVCPPPGKYFCRAVQFPNEQELGFSRLEDKQIEVEVKNLEVFSMIGIEYKSC